MSPEQIKVSPETICFPVTKEAVDKSLSSIAENPEGAHVEESFVMQFENPGLEYWLARELHDSPNYGTEPMTCAEGVVFTYRVLREQANLNGKVLPKISNEIYGVYIQDQIEFIKEHPKGDLYLFAEEKMKEISNHEPEFARAVNEATEYTAAKTAFYLGVVSVYLPIKIALRSAELDRKFTTGK